MRGDVLFWLTLLCAARLIGDGSICVVAPRLYSENFPKPDSEVWSYPRINGLGVFYRFHRWILNAPGRCSSSPRSIRGPGGC
jgi:hypothetical protein